MLTVVDDVLNGRSVSWLTDYSMVSKDYGEARIIDSTIDIQYLVSLYWAIVTMTTGKASIFLLVSDKASTFVPVKCGESHSYPNVSAYVIIRRHT